MKRGRDVRGQATIFIIAAILIIAFIALFFIFREKTPIKDSSQVIVSPIYTKTVSCLESTAREGTKYISLHGGYYKIPQAISYEYFTDEVPYYYMNYDKNIPPIERVEKELEDYIAYNLKTCINFSSIEEQGYNVSEGNISINAVVSGDEILIRADYPLTIKKGEDTSVLGEFETTIPSNIQRLYFASRDILNLYYDRPAFVCLTCLKETSNKYDVEAKATIMEDRKVVWFSITDSKNELNWRFVVEK
jgi:hypothetical protein